MDKKRTPASSDYAVSLEHRIKSLERLVGELKRASAQDCQSWMQAATSRAAPALRSPLGQTEQPAISANISRGHLARGNESTTVYYGPTSILCGTSRKTELNLAIYAPLSHPAPPEPTSNLEHVAAHLGIDMNGITMVVGLQNFFRWQYPHFMFIYREAFLRDHFGARNSCTYWSPALLMSISALGLLMSKNDCEREMSIRCFHAAESITLVTASSGSSLVLVQAFLCLAFYEIGRGNLSKGWSLSGT